EAGLLLGAFRIKGAGGRFGTARCGSVLILPPMLAVNITKSNRRATGACRGGGWYSKLKETSMTTASDTGNPPRPLAPRLRMGDEIPVLSLPNTSGVSVSSTVLLEPGPLIITFYRGIWCPYCRSDLMALINATFEVQSRGGSLAAIARETAPNSNRRFQQQHR